MTHVCLVLESLSATHSNEENESQYKKGYKGLGSFLYSNPHIKMSLAINGKTLMFLKKKHPEFLCILKELVSRNQAEVLGGGYYDPVFPLLLPRERTAQIDMLTSSITQEMGKRPHTACLFASAWDASLVSVFKTNGIDCVLLDSSAVEGKDIKDIPLVMSDRGKSIDIFPVMPAGASLSLNVLPDGNAGGDFVKTFCYTQAEIAEALKEGRFQNICEALSNRDDIALSTITDARAVRKRVRSYLAIGMAHSGGEAASIQEFLQSNEASDMLYHRQTLVALLIDQYHGDKLRKSTAREYLLSSQCGGYLFGGNTDESYEMLNEAECQVYSESETVTALDTNEDGLDEYMCRMECHTSVISEYGGSVTSFDAMTGKILRRYSNSLFSDSFAAPDGKVVLCKSYAVQKFLRGKREIFFIGQVAVGSTEVSLRKKYIVTSSGFVVQYIIKNSGKDKLSAMFETWFCFCHITEGVKTASLDAGGGNVSAVQLTDKESKVSFLIEPNEDAVLTKKERVEDGVSLSWQITLDAGMECEKTVSLAMLSKGNARRRRGETAAEPPVVAPGQLNLWDEE